MNPPLSKPMGKQERSAQPIFEIFYRVAGKTLFPPLYNPRTAVDRYMLVTRIMQSCQSQSELLHGLTQWIERLRDIQEAQRLELIEYTKPETIKLLDFERD